VIQKDIEPKYSSCEIENLFFHNKKLLNFSDTAALMSNLDLILTVDTAVGHLAGALGLNTILLIPDPPDFMSLTNTISSPWYPNTSMLRQSSRGQWALEDIKLAISSVIANKLEE
jgi:ADP-heptose:LPS heptosyltransferase